MTIQGITPRFEVIVVLCSKLGLCNANMCTHYCRKAAELLKVTLCFMKPISGRPANLVAEIVVDSLDGLSRNSRTGALANNKHFAHYKQTSTVYQLEQSHYNPNKYMDC